MGWVGEAKYLKCMTSPQAARYQTTGFFCAASGGKLTRKKKYSNAHNVILHTVVQYTMLMNTVAKGTDTKNTAASDKGSLERQISTVDGLSA